MHNACSSVTIMRGEPRPRGAANLSFCPVFPALSHSKNVPLKKMGEQRTKV